MRVFFTVLFILLYWCSAFSSNKTDSLMKVLKTEIDKKEDYDGQKLVRIISLKKLLLNVSPKDLQTRFNIYSKLYEEFKVFQFDSAYESAAMLETLSKGMNDMPKMYESKIKLGFTLLSAGMFTEAIDCLNHIDTHLITDSAKMEYYSLKARAYSDLAEYNDTKYYTPYDNALSLKFIDSAMALCKPGSYNKLMLAGSRLVTIKNYDKPSPDLINLLEHYPLTTHQRAMAACGLSFFYRHPGQEDEQLRLLLISSIDDIRSSTKETLAIFTLGEQLYRQGNLKDAYTFVQQAMDDAQFYGARLRKIKIGAVLPTIAAKKIIASENQKNRFLLYLLSIATIAILVTLISFIVFIQLKRLKAKEAIIEEKNKQLEKINDKLSEDAHIKEEYIGYFFNLISGYILKLEKLKRNIERKVNSKKFDDILLTINEINIKKERETLFYTFDHVFLKIFPNFITLFNSLLKEEDQIWPRDHEVLNTDLRIFALMRLGINDNQTIANILEYSVNTIYVYKMRIKAKAIVSSEQFDQKIMAIEAVETVNKN